SRDTCHPPPRGRPSSLSVRARGAKLADAPDLGSGGATRGGSNPPSRTTAPRACANAAAVDPADRETTPQGRNPQRLTPSAREPGRGQYPLTIEGPADEVESRLFEVARRFQQRASLPGFRRGKVPLERVRHEYAAEIEREFLERFIPQATQEAIAEAKLHA